MRLRGADVIGKDFELTNNLFSYTRLKEWESKVPEFLATCARAPKESVTASTGLRSGVAK